MTPQPSQPQFRLNILTHALAPYRMELYDQVMLALGSSWEGELIYGQDQQKDHQWRHLFDRKWNFTPVLAPAAEVPNWVFEMMRRVGLVRHPFVLPAVKAGRTALHPRPTLLWILEYSSYTIPALLQAWAEGIPVIVSTEMGRGMPRQDFSWVAEMKHRLMGRLVQGQVASSPWARRPCAEGIERIVVSPHAINTDKYTVLPEARPAVPVFLFVGNLIPRKGLDLWFAACAQLRRECNAPFRICLVGGGDESWARGVAAAEGLTDIVEFAGFKEGTELISEYQRASVFVLPSRYDTYGAVAHEAAACGLPLILSRHAGCSQILVEPEGNGFVVDPLQPAEITAAMKSMLENPELMHSMSHRSREVAEKWSVQNCGARVAQMIRELAFP